MHMCLCKCISIGADIKNMFHATVRKKKYEILNVEEVFVDNYC